MDIQIIQRKIYEIRGYQVMFDFDLAAMYGVPTKVLKQAVKRNIRRFPPDFMFLLTEEEFTNLRSQIVTSSWGGMRYLPFAFTEQGVTMLSSVLKSDEAIDVSIDIVRAFVALRHYIITYAELNQKLESFMLGTNLQFKDIYEALADFAGKKELQEKPRKQIGYKTSVILK